MSRTSLLHRRTLDPTLAHRALVVLVLVFVVSAEVPASEQSELDGQPIVRIIFERNDVFDTTDPATSGKLYRAANAVHIRSREGLIRSVLLFAEGDPYSASTAAESARLLRKLGIMNPVEITAVKVEDGVEVTVRTHDQWSLQIGADAGLAGNRADFELQVQEENLLGMGKRITFEYASDVERDARSVRYEDPNILGSRWKTDLIYEDRSDGDLQRIRLERPFYALETANAWGGWWESEELVEHLWSDAETVVRGYRSIDVLRGWYGIRLGDPGRITRRVTVGWETIEARYGDWIFDESGLPYATPLDRKVSGFHLGFQQITDNFEVLHGFRAWSTQEDVALGPNFRFDATLSAPALGGDINRVLFDGEFSVARHRGSWLLLADAWFSGRFDDGDPRNIVTGFQLAASQIGNRGFQFRALVDTSHELDLDRQLALGADVGLRGWDPDTFDGTGRALVNAQWRRLLFEDVLQLFSVGVVVFADAGTTWDPRVGRDTDGIRTDAGVGLLLDLSRVSTTNLLRIEVGWPDDGSGAVITLTGSALF